MKKKIIEDFKSGDIQCIKCGETITLYFNGGELDRKEHCGYIYETVATGYNLEIKKMEKES